MKQTVCALTLLCGLAVACAAQAAAPPLPPPGGNVVNVSTVAQLQAAVQALASNTTIVVAPGTYVLSNPLYVNGTMNNVGIRGATNNYDDVKLVGPGMTATSGALFGIWTGGNIAGITIANLTIRDFPDHPIILNTKTSNPFIHNVHLINAGQQFIKSNPDASGGGVNNGLVEYSTLEYTATAPGWYTNGVDVHTGANWTIRHNVFRNIVSPPGQPLAGPAVLIWNRSSNVITEANLFVNCARAIAYGLQVLGNGFDNTGGIIRNNIVFRAANQPGDVGISVADSPNTQVLNNTVYLSGTFGWAIEYRFAQTTGVVIENNLVDTTILRRDGATGTVTNNYPAAPAGMFVNAAAGDLHLAASAAGAIDRGLMLANVVDDFDGEPRPAGSGYDIGADEYGAATVTYHISGKVTNSAGAALAGVTMTLSGARIASTKTNAYGTYAFVQLPAGQQYTVTPSLPGYAFNPPNASFSNLSSNQPLVNFVSTP